MLNIPLVFKLFSKVVPLFLCFLWAGSLLVSSALSDHPVHSVPSHKEMRKLCIHLPVSGILQLPKTIYGSILVYRSTHLSQQSCNRYNMAKFSWLTTNITQNLLVCETVLPQLAEQFMQSITHHQHKTLLCFRSSFFSANSVFIGVHFGYISNLLEFEV